MWFWGLEERLDITLLLIYNNTFMEIEQQWTAKVI